MTQPRRTPGRGGPTRRSGPSRAAGGSRVAGRPAAFRTTPARGGVTPIRATQPGPADRVRATPARSAAADPGRSASRPASARRAAAGGAAQRTRAPQPHRLTGRATVLGLVLGALLLAYAYPVRIYLNQQAQIAALKNSQAAQRRHIGQLTDDVANYQDPTFIMTEATRRLNMTLPGEKLYHVSWPGSSPASTPDTSTSKVKDTGPWYGQLWSSLQAADDARTAP